MWWDSLSIYSFGANKSKYMPNDHTADKDLIDPQIIGKFKPFC